MGILSGLGGTVGCIHVVRCDDPHHNGCKKENTFDIGQILLARSKALELHWEVKVNDADEVWSCPECVKQLIVTTLIPTKDLKQLVDDISWSKATVGTIITLSDCKSGDDNTWKIVLKFENNTRKDIFFNIVYEEGVSSNWVKFFCKKEVEESVSA